MYTAESYTVFLLDNTVREHGWCVKNGDDTVCDVYEGKAMAERIANLLNSEK